MISFKKVSLIAILFIVCLPFLNINITFGMEESEKLLLEDLSNDAIEYHDKAKESIEKNDLDNAIKYLQKAIILNPYYVKTYNDLGIIYEKKAMMDEARKMYESALNLEPDYAPTYMNLAMLEESLGNIDKAIFYWKARIVFGRASDEWTKRAKLKLKRYAPEEAKKIDAGVLIEEVLDKLKLDKVQMNKLAKKHVAYGKAYFSQGEYSLALDEFRIAAKLYTPRNIEIQRLIAEATIGIMQQYFARGIQYYKNADYESAEYNFNKLVQLLPE